jgi:hypothetical protein
MSEAVAPSRAMRRRANRNERSVARGIDVDSQILETTKTKELYQRTRPRETLCRNFARNFVSRDRSLRTPFRGGNRHGLPSYFIHLGHTI